MSSSDPSAVTFRVNLTLEIRLNGVNVDEQRKRIAQQLCQLCLGNAIVDGTPASVLLGVCTVDPVDSVGEHVQVLAEPRPV